MDWDALIERHGGALLLYARQWTRTRADAEDAVQDGFLRVWRSRARELDDPVPVLFAAVKRSAIDAGRRAARRAARERRALAESEADGGWFEESEADAEQAQRLEAALRTVPEEQRTVLVLKLWGQMTFAQVAASLGVSPNTAASRYRYGLDALRRRLGVDGGQAG